QRVADVEARVAHVEALIQTLRAAANDDHLLAEERRHAILELLTRHEATAPELVELAGEGQSVEVVRSCHGWVLLRARKRGRRGCRDQGPESGVQAQASPTPLLRKLMFSETLVAQDATLRRSRGPDLYLSH